MPNLTVEPPSLEETATPLLDEKTELPCESASHDHGKFHGGPGRHWIIFHHVCEESRSGLTIRCDPWYRAALALFAARGTSRCHDCGFIGAQADYFTVIGSAL